MLETHIHNDYVSGGLALARQAGATYAIPAGEPVSFSDECRALDDGDAVAAGRLGITAIATAGHTAHHLAYLVELPRDGEAADAVVCTGGSLLANATGRTDLLGLERAETLAHAQWHSVRRLLTTLPAAAQVLPTHGFGSFCSAAPTSGCSTAVPTIGHELESNPAALLDEESFVAALLADLPPIPAYYPYMSALNRRGLGAPRLEPVRELDAGDLDSAVAGDEWVVDLRERRAFAAEHRPGTLNLELGTNLTTYLGWIVPWDGELVLLADNPAALAEARRLIARIGRDELGGSALWPEVVSQLRRGSAGAGRGTSSYPVASFSDLAKAWRDRTSARPQVIDVRHTHEWHAGHIAGARHVPIQELLERRSEVPATAQVWVHCAGGFRAAVAASLLSGWGASPVLIDDLWENAAVSSLPITPRTGPAERRAS